MSIQTRIPRRMRMCTIASPSMGASPAATGVAAAGATAAPARLFDPRDAAEGDWPEGPSMARSYIESIARAGVPAMVANADGEWLALRSGERVYPVTVTHGERGGSYVCLPHSAYVLYGRRELALVELGLLAAPMRGALVLVDGLLRAVRINRIAHIDNWLLSTNLHGDWKGEDVPALRDAVAARFPHHLIAVRSVDPWSSPELDAALRADGWLMLPSRQVWVVDDVARQWRPRNSSGHDLRAKRQALRRGELTQEDVQALRPGDAQRISELYGLLYLEKYSGLNPAFTPAWVAMTHASGMVRYRVVRDAAGRIQAVAGSFVRGGVLTPPVVGYDTSRPRREALYRIASCLFCEQAESLGARRHGSAGAADFKRARGARPVIECTAVWIGALAPWRRALLRLFAAMLWRVAVPLMRRRQL